MGQLTGASLLSRSQRLVSSVFEVDLGAGDEVARGRIGVVTFGDPDWGR